MLDKLNICQAPFFFFVLFFAFCFGGAGAQNLFSFAAVRSTPEKRKVDLFTLTML